MDRRWVETAQSAQLPLLLEENYQPRTVLRVPAPLPQSELGARNGHVSLSTFAPVNQGGSFEFDRVLKAGAVLKRNKRTRVWKSVHLVLRPNLLSIYKDGQETQLRHQVNLSEITAVALQKDRKRKGEHNGVFGLYSPSRNFHFEAFSEQEARIWIELIRRESRIDEENENIRPAGDQKVYTGLGHSGRLSGETFNSSRYRGSSSSPEPRGRTSTTSRFTATQPIPIRQLSHTQDYSGNDYGSYSEFSDTPAFGSYRNSSLGERQSVRVFPSVTLVVPHENSHSGVLPQTAGSESQLSVVKTSKDEERVVCHGHLLCLKSRRGVRHWKRYWAVLRPKNLALYKNEEEYAANLIIPLTSVVDAVEIDPMSKSKKFCLQIITEDRSYRFCALNEDDLSKWLGAFKSVLAKRGETNPGRIA